MLSNGTVKETDTLLLRDLVIANYLWVPLVSGSCWPSLIIITHNSSIIYSDGITCHYYSPEFSLYLNL